MLRVEALLWLLSCLCATRCFDRTRIINGEETTIEEHPYMAVFQKWNKGVCGATLIHPSWAMTAKHCIRGDEVIFEITLRVGSTYRSSGGWVIDVDDFNVYKENPGNDIAVLHGKTEFPLGDKVKLIRVPVFLEDARVGDEGLILGWGRSSKSKSQTDVLKKLAMVVTDRHECEHAAPFPISIKVICAKPKVAGADSCRGDSGGPLVVSDTAVGIISRSSCSGHPGAHVLFTNVAFYVLWMMVVTSSETNYSSNFSSIPVTRGIYDSRSFY